MNSIRPLATVVVLAVIGVGLYMVINTSEPIPPEDAADAMLAVPQIEDDLAAMIDEGTPQLQEPGAGGSSASGEDTSAPPPWEASPTLRQRSASAPPLPEDHAIQALPHSADESMQARAPSFSSSEEYDDAFSAQLNSQMRNGAAPSTATRDTPYAGGQRPEGEAWQDLATRAPSAGTEQVPSVVENPHVHKDSSAQGTWGSIPSRDVAEDAASGSAGLPAERADFGDLDSAPTSVTATGAVPPVPSGRGTMLPAGGTGHVNTTPFSVAWAATQETLRRGDLSQALLMLSEYYGDPQLSSAESNQLQELLSQLAGTVIYSTSHELEEPYHVQQGETLADVAQKYEVTPELLAKINGISDPSRLSPGTELKVVRGPFNAVVDESGLRLVLRGRYAGRFTARGPANWPVDSWTVQQKVPAADAAAGPSASSGKHLVLTPATPGADVQPVAVVADDAASGQRQPVVRVSAQDMNDLYDILTIGSRVTVVR